MPRPALGTAQVLDGVAGAGAAAAAPVFGGDIRGPFLIRGCEFAAGRFRTAADLERAAGARRRAPTSAASVLRGWEFAGLEPVAFTRIAGQRVPGGATGQTRQSADGAAGRGDGRAGIITRLEARGSHLVDVSEGADARADVVRDRVVEGEDHERLSARVDTPHLHR